ncbi:MAG: hypothetical protein BWY93_01764 [Euryarchaeota archaeon ADurb.BinA087]|nr:MAG: hypothetical protein BWY93_01764 [Euryarchaeota archaeon ADurb.BinA087]
MLLTAAFRVTQPFGVVGIPGWRSGNSTDDATTSIWFMVRVPVLSVQMTVTEPTVSHAMRRRTRLNARVIFRIVSARETVTLTGRPSGTETTIMITANMKLSRT